MRKSSTNRDRAKALGTLLKAKRKALGYSTYDVARAAGVAEPTVVRYEQGQFVAPRPDKLVRFAELLQINLADLYALAGYAVPSELPDFPAYLRAKYPELSPAAVLDLIRRFNKLQAASQKQKAA